MKNTPHDLELYGRDLRRLLSDEPDIVFAVLIGSRADGTAHPGSDWDIALQWEPQHDWMALLGKTETLRGKIAETVGVRPEEIDLVDLRRANLAMRGSVAEEGVLLTVENTLAWPHFLRRTWRELEDYYWERHHAA